MKPSFLPSHKQREKILTNPNETHGNIVRISLDASLKSDLQWEEQMQYARMALDQNKKILWSFTYHFFKELTQPLADTQQYLTLKCALDHFKRHVWGEFESHSLGINFELASHDFLSSFIWGASERESLVLRAQHQFGTCQQASLELGFSIPSWESLEPGDFFCNERSKTCLRLFCMAAYAEYMEYIASHLPQELPIFVQFDSSFLKCNLEKVYLLFGGFFRYLQPYMLHIDCLSLLSWTQEGFFYGPKPFPSFALCLPDIEQLSPLKYHRMDVLLEKYQKKGVRFIAEQNLTHLWEGVDHLSVFSDCLSLKTSRMLKGFQAAGGKVCFV